MKRSELRALEKAWATQDPKPGYDRVAMFLSVEDTCEAGGHVRAFVELPHAVVLWLLRNLGEFADRG